jgi:hypothetical protein
MKFYELLRENLLSPDTSRSFARFIETRAASLNECARKRNEEALVKSRFFWVYELKLRRKMM